MNRRQFGRNAFTLLLASAWSSADLAARARPPDALLWEVRGGGVRNWLFGTLHQADSRLWPLPGPVEKVFSQSRRLVIELRQDALTSLEFYEDSQGQGDDTVGALANPVLRERTLAALIRRGVAADQAASMKRWAALLKLTEIPSGAGVSMDQGLYVETLRTRRRVIALDSVEEQVAVFDSLPADTQIALLGAALALEGNLPALLEATVIAYIARDFARLVELQWGLARDRLDLRPHLERLNRKLIVDRSVVMAYRMQGALRTGDSFVALGASHLIGPYGLLALLKTEYGWSLRPLF